MRANCMKGLRGKDAHWFRDALGELDLLAMPLKMLCDSTTRELPGGHSDALWVAGELERSFGCGIHAEQRSAVRGSFA